MHAKKPSPQETEKDGLAQVLAKLVEMFRQGGSAKDFQWWNSQSPRSIFSPLYGYSDGQQLFDEVVQGVLKLNPDMLSEHEVQSRLVWDFLQPQTISLTRAAHLNSQSLVMMAKQHLSNLVEFQAWQNVDIPISNLWLDGAPVEVGYVTFMELPKHELEQWMKDQVLWPAKAPDVRVVARVKAPGDQHKALSYAIDRVGRTLDVLRAFCFPFGRESDTWQIGVVGDVISSASTPMRIDNKTIVTRLGPGLAQIELRRHILSKLQQPQWELVTTLIQKMSHTRMENKLLGSVHWLGESTKPDTNKSKFAKISFALETLIGGEPQDEELKVRGITAMLAERAAFLVGRDPADRLDVDKAIRKYYGIRGGIVHGEEEDISFDDIDGFGQLVRRISIALLEKLNDLGDEIGNVEKLEGWVRKKKYGMLESGN